MHLIYSKRNELKRLQVRRAQMLEGYQMVVGMRVIRETQLQQMQQAIYQYQQLYAQENRNCQKIRSKMYRSTQQMERLCQSNTWVTASEHERLYTNSQHCVNKLCKVRLTLSQYEKDILELRQKAEDSTARLIGLDRALVTLTLELHDIDYALLPITNPARDFSLVQNPRIYPVKYNLLC